MKLRGVSHNFTKSSQLLALLSDEQLGVANDVDQQNVTDLQLKIRITRHIPIRLRSYTSFPAEFIKSVIEITTPYAIATFVNIAPLWFGEKVKENKAALEINFSNLHQLISRVRETSCNSCLHGCFSSQSFWKAGSPRKASHSGSSLNSA